MKFLKQRTFTDCLRTCISSILEIDYREVPDFYEIASEYNLVNSTGFYTFLYDWLTRKGYDVQFIDRDNKHLVEDCGWNIGIYYNSPTTTHATVGYGANHFFDPLNIDSIYSVDKMSEFQRKVKLLGYILISKVETKP